MVHEDSFPFPTLLLYCVRIKNEWRRSSDDKADGGTLKKISRRITVVAYMSVARFLRPCGGYMILPAVRGYMAARYTFSPLQSTES